MKKIVDCYKAIYSLEIAHRDLKPANILIKKGKNGKLIFKFADFGQSK